MVKLGWRVVKKVVGEKENKLYSQKSQHCSSLRICIHYENASVCGNLCHVLPLASRAESHGRNTNIFIMCLVVAFLVTRHQHQGNNLKF